MQCVACDTCVCTCEYSFLFMSAINVTTVTVVGWHNQTADHSTKYPGINFGVHLKDDANLWNDSPTCVCGAA